MIKIKLGFKQVVDVFVFNEDGQLVIKLDSLKENSLVLNSDDNDTNYLFIKDGLLDTTMLESMGTLEETVEESDYNKLIKGNGENKTKTIAFGSKKYMPCKIICLGNMIDQETKNWVNFKIEIPKAVLVNKLSIYSNNINISDFDYVFQIEEFNDKGDLFKFHIEE